LTIYFSYDELLSMFAFKFNLRPYVADDSRLAAHLQAGLAALKVAHVAHGGGSPAANAQDPLHLPAFQRMVKRCRLYR